MGLVRTWSRQVARAAGASLIAPLVLLLAAGGLAAGGGVGGLESLGQITSGPALPDTGLATASSSSIEGAEIVGADLPVPARTEPASPPASQLASAAPPAPAETAGPRTGVRLAPPPPSAGPGPRLDTGEDALAGEPENGAPPAGSDPLDELEETTRGLGGSLSEPLRPVTSPLLDLLRLLGPPPR